MRRWLWPTCLTVLAVAALVRGAWPIRAAHAAPLTEALGMSAAQYRYLHSQSAHWRACMLKR